MITITDVAGARSALRHHRGAYLARRAGWRRWLAGLLALSAVAPVPGSGADGLIPFESVTLAVAPPAVRAWVAANCRHAAQTLLHEEAHSYVIVCRGPQRTSGYRVAVTEVVREGDRLLVTATLHNPAAHGEAVLMAITSPLAIVRFPRLELPLTVRFVRG